jgi:hypothetical protein
MRQAGVVLIREAASGERLAGLLRAAAACFEAIENGAAAPRLESYRYTPFSTSVTLAALADYGCGGDELFAPLQVHALQALVAGAVCRPEHCWVRKRYAPRLAPPRAQPNFWHQDGGLGTRYGARPGEVPPMTQLLTCWLPLEACHGTRPGLEFVRPPVDRLLHYTELSDAALRSRFAPEEFWIPRVDAGDALVFSNGILHRTHISSDMEHNRLSVEYRLFPAC